MKIFGKKKRDMKQKKEPKHIRVIRLMLWRLFKKTRLRERIKKANEWAGQHIGTTASITISLLSISLLVGILITVLTPESEENPAFEGIVLVSPMFDGMRRIQENKTYQVSQVEQMTLRGKQLKHELDSLVRIPLKSHDDSVKIVVKYKQLEMIVRNLENN